MHAAEVLHVSQPALTQNLKKLEDRYDVNLLKRSRQGVTLTSYGKILYDHVQSMANLHKQAIEKINELKHKKEHSLLLGTGHVFWELCLKQVLDDYQSMYPKASIHVEFGNNLALLDRTLSGFLELFFGHEVLGLSKQSELKFVPLFESERAWFVRESHPLAGGVVSEDQVHQFPALEITANDERYGNYIERLEENVIEKKRRDDQERRYISTNSMTAGIEVLRSKNVVLGFPLEYREYMKQFNIIPLQTDHPPYMERIGAYYHPVGISQSAEELLLMARSCFP